MQFPVKVTGGIWNPLMASATTTPYALGENNCNDVNTPNYFFVNYKMYGLIETSNVCHYENFALNAQTVQNATMI